VQPDGRTGYEVSLPLPMLMEPEESRFCEGRPMRGVEGDVNWWSAFSSDPPVLRADVRALSWAQGFYDQARVWLWSESIDRQYEPGAADRQAVRQTAAWR
jgi:hypothetical protein